MLSHNHLPASTESDIITMTNSHGTAVINKQDGQWKVASFHLATRAEGFSAGAFSIVMEELLIQARKPTTYTSNDIDGD